MRVLTAVLAVCLVALSLSPEAVARRAPQVRRTGVCDTLMPLELLFRFGTGAEPAAAPTLGPHGEIYVGTRDGIVHALRADGSYHWSFTLDRAVTGRALVDSTGRVLVPTSRSIYALRPDGRLAWEFSNPVELLGDLVRDGQGRIRFASADGRLFEFDERGLLVRNVRAERPWSALPVALTDGSVVGGSAGGLVLVSRPKGAQRFALSARVDQVLGCPGQEICAISGGRLEVLGQKPSRPITARRAGNRGEHLAVLHDDRTLELYRGVGRERLYSLRLPDSASGAPVVDERGRVFVPLMGGALVAFGVDGKVLGCEQVAHSALATPVLARSGTLLVGAREGLIAAIRAE